MKRFIISAVCAAAAATSLTAATASAAAVNNSVSGYLSTTTGEQIAGFDTTMWVEYYEKEDKSVIRAIGDLAEDFKSVTGKNCWIDELKEEDFHLAALPPHGIWFPDGVMHVSVYDEVPADSKCYVATYTPDGALHALVQSVPEPEYVFENGNTLLFKFDQIPERPEFGTMKAFVWDNNMKPLDPEPLEVMESARRVFIGTLGTGGRVDEFAKENAQIAALSGKRESFTIQNINGSIVIAGSDKRGTIYGIYDLCEKMGVSPWKFWADVEPEKTENLYINLPEGGYTEDEPSVEYRGIFLNDEFNMNKWTNSVFAENMNLAKYEKVYELILRLKMNTLWPAMHKYSTAFHKIDGAAAKADEYGIVVGSSHAEPLLRNNLGELDKYQADWMEANPDKPLNRKIENETGNKVAYYWSSYDSYDSEGNGVGTYYYNKEFLTDYWRESIKASGAYDNIYTLGMRGVHDGSFSTNMDNETALKEIIATQIQILRDELVGEGKKYSRIEDVPMVFIPYKDVLQYYNKPDRLNLPEYVTIMWTDDNYGYMRQNSNETERTNSGRGGVYYHISYYGWPTSYLWISSTQPALIREQLTRSYEMGSDKMWIVNVGDLKPAEKEIEYYARLSRDIDGMNETDISDVYTEMAKRDFNMTDQDAAEYADIMDTYYELANSKRPEFYRTNDESNKLNISVTAYGDEGERYINRYKDITERVEALYEKLPDSKKPSFYELALYPIRSAKNMAVDFVQASHATLYNEQGRYGAVNALSAEANAAAKQIEDDTTAYNTMLDGKWNKMMVINPSHFSSCDARLTTALNPPTITELDYTDMGISAEELSISKYDSYAKSIDIYNTGYGSFDYEITSDNPAITLSKTSGTVYGSERVYVTLDASKAVAGTSAGTITVSRKLGENTVKTATVNVSISNPADISTEKTYVEAYGTVSLEAEHYTSLTDNGVYKWQVEKDFGRSGDSLKIYPNLSDDVTNTAAEMLSNSAVALYDIYFETTGTYNVNIYRMPTLNERGYCRVGIGLDDSDPVAIGGTNAYPSTSGGTKTKTYAWPNNVLKNNEILKTTVTVNEAGKHTLKLYNVSSGMVIDKIVLVKGDVPYSYFGAPESYNTTYNNEITVPETIDDTEKDESGITKTFEPDVLAAVPLPSGPYGFTGEVIKLTDKYDNAVVAKVGYDSNGNIVSVDTMQLDFTQVDIYGSVKINDFLGDLTHINDIAAFEIIVFDSYTNLEPIAPIYRYGDVVSEAEESNMRVNADLRNYTGKKSIVLVADEEITEDITDDHIKYLYAEELTEKSYKSIPFTGNAEGLYNIRVGIDGENPINETRSTVINITPDNNGVPIYEYKEDFEDSYDTSAWTKRTDSSTVSVEEGDSKYLQFATTTGTTGAYTNLANAVDASGRKVYIGADILFTTPSGSPGNSQLAIGNAYSSSSSSFSSSNIDWGIVSTNAGHIIMLEYIGADKTLTVNGQSVSNEFIGKWTHMEALVNFKTHTMDITLTADGVTEAKLTDVPFYSASYTDTIGGLYLRAAKVNGTTSVDNFGVYTLSAPQYAISVTAVDGSDNEINGAAVTVKNSSGTAISPAENGKYMLTEGIYEITVTANGYEEKAETLNLTPALESKDVKITLTPSEQS